MLLLIMLAVHRFSLSAGFKAPVSAPNSRPVSPPPPITTDVGTDDLEGQENHDDDDDEDKASVKGGLITLDTLSIHSTTALSERSLSRADSSTIHSSRGSISLLTSTAELGAEARFQRIRVKLKHRTQAEFSDLFLVQQLLAHSPVYAMKFSPDGGFLAAGCGDGTVKVYKVFCEEVLGLMEVDPEYSPPAGMAAVFSPEPWQRLEGHTGQVVDLSWSSTNNLLLSASVDGTVRLWHPSKPDCLAIFPHRDIVSSVAFHPRDDRLFVSGCFDCRVRLWSVDEHKVRAWNELPAGNYVTAVAFTSNGRFALAGAASGVMLMFETQGFKYHTQILVRTNPKKKAKKICSIVAKPGRDDDTILVASNDSRIRTYSLRDKTMACKFKGHANESSQIPAAFSSDGEYVISGSEDGRCVIWPVEGRHKSGRLFASRLRDRNDSYEHFQPYSVPATVAVFAPPQLHGRLVSCKLRPLLPEGASPGYAEGHVFATADTQGRIRIFENSQYIEDWVNKRA
jgi:WD40 repeat protein